MTYREFVNDTLRFIAMSFDLPISAFDDAHRRYLEWENRQRLRLMLLSMSIVLFAATWCEAGTPAQRALAAVAVARAKLQLAAEKPQLRDSGDHFSHAASPNISESKAVPPPPAETPEIAPRSPASPLPLPAVFKQPMTSEVIPAKESDEDAEPLTVPIQASAPLPKVDPPKTAKLSELMPSGPMPARPMRITFDKSANPAASLPVANSAAMPAQLVIKCWPRGCDAGERQKNEVIQKLIPLGWKVGAGYDRQIRFADADPNREGCPTIILYVRGQERKRWEDYTRTEILSNELLAGWNEGLRQQSKSYAAHGPGGTIECADEIRQVISYLRKYIGDGVAMSIIWDRNGAQSIPLLAKAEWTPLAVLGSSGHFQVDAKGAIGLPIDVVGAGYKLRGNDPEIDLDPMKFPGLLKKLSMNQSPFSGVLPDGGRIMPAEGRIAGVFVIDDIVAYWGIISAFQGIFHMLQPSLDLLLPGQVELTVELNGDVITVDFQHAPTVKLVELFEFDLVVKRVVMTVKNVHVQFSGSNWIKSRDWPVTERR